MPTTFRGETKDTMAKEYGPIDRAFSNLDWYNAFDFTQVEYMAEVISNNTPLFVIFPNYLRVQAAFKYYDMWSKDSRIQAIVVEALSHKPLGCKMYQLTEVLKGLRKPLKQVNNCRFKDIYHQLATRKAILKATRT